MEGNIQHTAEEILGRALYSQEQMAAQEVTNKTQHLNSPLPMALQAFYMAIGKASLFMQGFQHFLLPEQLYVIDDKLVFLKENQEVIYWAVDLKKPALVYQTTNLFIENEPIQWYQEALPLPMFLNWMLYFQCLMADGYLHQQTSSGFEYFATLDLTTYPANTIAQQLIAELSQWTKSIKNEEMTVFWRKESIVSCVFDEQGRVNGTVYLCTKEECFLEQVVEAYGFEEL